MLASNYSTVDRRELAVVGTHHVESDGAVRGGRRDEPAELRRRRGGRGRTFPLWLRKCVFRFENSKDAFFQAAHFFRKDLLVDSREEKGRHPS